MAVPPTSAAEQCCWKKLPPADQTLSVQDSSSCPAGAVLPTAHVVATEVISATLVMVDVAVSNDVAVRVVVETPTRVLRVERASTACTETASKAAMDSSFMIRRMPDNNVP